ncbi:MAG TPA: 6-phosphogluconolactonase, partial [Luteibacter sp.]|nr:6-phosphogluconolactonase [Luteibacter sp.]
MTSNLSLKTQLRDFPDPQALAQALAQAVADDLRAALAARASASLALSGGNTPKAFMQALALQTLDWARVAVTLVDERWVPESNPRSNAALLKANLLDGPAAMARFVPLHRAVPQPEDALAEVERALLAMPLPFDAL